MTGIARILLVDDDVAGRYALSRCLVSAGYDVVEAETGAAGLDLARSGSCDLVLLDAKLPDVSGFDICAQLKASPLTSGIPIVQISAHFKSSEDRARALRAGADAYVTTPFEPAEVLEQVGALLRLRDAKLALKQSEERYRLLFEKNPDAVFSMDPHGRFTLLNPACERISGFSQAELLGKTFMDVCHPACLQSAIDQFRTALGGAEFNSFGMAIVRKDGALAELTVSGEPVTENGAVVAVYCTARDITARKRSEEELRRTKDLLKGITEATHDLVAALDKDFRYLAFNQQYKAEFQRIFGPVISIGTSMIEALAHLPDDQQKAVQMWGRALAGEAFSETVELGDPRLERKVFHLEYGPIRDADGNVIAAAHIVRDVTEQHRVQERLRSGEEQLRIALASGRMGTWVWDLATNLVLTDSLHRELWDIDSPEPLVPADLILSRIHPDDLSAVHNQAKPPGAPFETEFRIIRRDGQVRWLRGSGHTRHDETGKVTKVIGVNFDITERKQAENALRESEARFRTMADGTPVLIWVTDTRGAIRFVNRTYCEFFGVTTEQVQKHGWQPTVHPEDHNTYESAFAAALAGRRHFHAQARVRRADGLWRWVESFGAPLYSEKGEFLGMAGTSPDITERKEFQAELERLVGERTVKLNELVGELEHFSYSITHDMRAPLRAMRGFAEALRERIAEGSDPEAKLFINKIVTAATRMDLLITDALSYNKTVRQELHCEPVDAGKVLSEMLETYPEFLAHRDCIHVQGHLPVLIANEAALIQCFSNLIGNALKFVPRGKPPEVRISARILDSSERAEGIRAGETSLVARQVMPPPGQRPIVRAGKWARIMVHDNGIGMPASILPRLFSMFGRGTTDYEGTGIGLALVRKVIHRMGGQVGAESREGQGSCFWFELPLAEYR